MGALTVLGLQLLLLACSLGAEGFPEWSVSDTERTEELSSKEVPPYFETGYGELHQAEAPELGLEMRYQAPQDYDMLMKHSVRRSDKKKKRNRNKQGALSPLGSSHTKREEEAKAEEQLPKHPRQKPRQGQMSALGSTGENEAPAENHGPE